MIAATDLPISFGDNEFFGDFMTNYVQPQYRKVTRNTTRADLIDCYNKSRLALKSQITSANFCVALTSDIWNCRANTDYISVVAHYCDPKWDLQKRVIGFKYVASNHTGTVISENILNVIQDWQIDNRIISITLDNASANVKAMEYLEGVLSQYVGGFVLHQRCICHIINLIVQAGMNMIKHYINKVREAISFLNGSSQRVREFKQFCHAEGLKPRKFQTDMPVRWNSTYLMLKSVMDYKNALTVYYNSKMGFTELGESDWFIVDKFVQFLEIFYDSSTLLSGIYYPTSPLVLHKLLEIAQLFHSNRADLLFGSIINVMDEKFKKYFSEMPLLYCIAFVLDPRLRLQGLQMCLEHIGECLDLDYSAQYNNVCTKLYEVYAKYESKFGNCIPSQQAEQQEAQENPRKKKNKTIFDIMSSRRGGGSSSSSSSTTSTRRMQHMELKTYLETDFSMMEIEYEDFNILQWWRGRERHFPVLSRLARDILTIHVSTVSSESCFSTSARIIEDRRVRLTPEMVEVLTCLRDWEHAERRLQHTAHDEELVQQFQSMYIEDENQDVPGT